LSPKTKSGYFVKAGKLDRILLVSNLAVMVTIYTAVIL